ncbi:MAG: DUF2384 domain-containing protein [Saprospiraceae bacterium]|jgi:putative toxin-antitoxin system antitoxin component (TIGR02293 family)|nr:DUF2384 domain-containing protein [Saprospiraceae bacterium]
MKKEKVKTAKKKKNLAQRDSTSTRVSLTKMSRGHLVPEPSNNLAKLLTTVPRPYSQVVNAMNQVAGSLVLSASKLPHQNIDAILPDDFQLVQYSRQGMPTTDFISIVQACLFTPLEWIFFLQTEDRIFQKYTIADFNLTPFHSERSLEIFRLFRQGQAVFGSAADFYAWLKSEVPALGGIRPISLLDNTFGIGIVRDELTRIEHGVLA